MKKIIALFGIMIMMLTIKASAGPPREMKPKHICFTVSCCSYLIFTVEVLTGKFCFDTIDRYGAPVNHSVTITPAEGVNWDGNGDVTVKDDITYRAETGESYRVVKGEYHFNDFTGDLMIEEIPE